MESTRPTPFDLVFGPLADERFPPIRVAFEASRGDPRDRDAFLMVREVIQLVHDLRPDEGMGEELGHLAAVHHHAYLFWLAGTPTLEITPAELAGLLRQGALVPGDVAAPPPAFYVQLPERRVWAEVVPGAAHEPLDGCFLALGDDGSLRVLGAFGLRSDRPGLSVVEVAGPRPQRLARADGSPLFAPVLAGGDIAGLASITGGEELLEFGWRAWSLAGERST
jgi:hypothetical protein